MKRMLRIVCFSEALESVCGRIYALKEDGRGSIERSV